MGRHYIETHAETVERLKKEIEDKTAQIAAIEAETEGIRAQIAANEAEWTLTIALLIITRKDFETEVEATMGNLSERERASIDAAASLFGTDAYAAIHNYAAFRTIKCHLDWLAEHSSRLRCTDSLNAND